MKPYARQAIQTTYYGPTNTRASHILAKAQGGKARVAWDDALTADENHIAAALALAAKMGWDRDGLGSLAFGALPDGDHVFVWTANGDCLVYFLDRSESLR